MKSFPSVLPAQSKQTDKKKTKTSDDFPFSSHENCGWWAIKLFSSRFDPENAKPSRPAPRVFVVFDCALVVGLVFLRFLLSLHKLCDCGCSVRYFCLDHQLSLCVVIRPFFAVLSVYIATVVSRSAECRRTAAISAVHRP